MKNRSIASHTVAATMGTLVGLAGIDHGIFEILQGNVAPDGLLFAAIGPEQRFWTYGEETALTIVPNLLVSGILAVILGVAVTLRSLTALRQKHAAPVLFLLSVALFLVGGGFAPITMTLLATFMTTQIHRPLGIWRRLIPAAVLKFLGRSWRPTLILFVVIFIFSVVIAIFGWPLTAFFSPEATLEYLNNLAFIMVALMILTTPTALAHDAAALDGME